MSDDLAIIVLAAAESDHAGTTVEVAVADHLPNRSAARSWWHQFTRRSSATDESLRTFVTSRFGLHGELQLADPDQVQRRLPPDALVRSGVLVHRPSC